MFIVFYTWDSNPRLLSCESSVRHLHPKFSPILHSPYSSTEDELHFLGTFAVIFFASADAVGPFDHAVDDGTNVPAEMSDTGVAPLKEFALVGAGEGDIVGRGNPKFGKMLKDSQTKGRLIYDEGGRRCGLKKGI